MAGGTFSLSYETCKQIREYNVLVARTRNGFEQRRVISSNKIIGWSFKSPFLTKTQMQEYETFFDDQTGSFSTFIWTEPFNDVSYNVRFDGQFRTDYENGGYYVTWAFRKISAV